MLIKYLQKEAEWLSELTRLTSQFHKLLEANDKDFSIVSDCITEDKFQIYADGWVQLVSIDEIKTIFNSKTARTHQELYWFEKRTYEFDELKSFYDTLIAKSVFIEFITHYINQISLNSKWGNYYLPNSVNKSAYILTLGIDNNSFSERWETDNDPISYTSRNAESRMVNSTLSQAQKIGVNAFAGNKLGEYLKYYISDEINGISLQYTPNSYSQIARRGRRFVLSENVENFQVIKIDDGELETDLVSVGSEEDLQSLASSFLTQEEYVRNIQKTTDYKFENYNVKDIWNTLNKLFATSCVLYGDDVFYNSISIKLVFDVVKNEFVYVNVYDLLQSIMFLCLAENSLARNDTINIYYDSQAKKLVLSGEDYEIVSETQAGQRGQIQSVQKQTIIIPSFSIIEQQDPKNQTKVYFTEYLQLQDENLDFRSKEALVNYNLPKGLKLDNEFKLNYPTVAENYRRQIQLSFNPAEIDVKIDNIKSFMDAYLGSYSEQVTNDAGESFRRAKPKETWSNPDYVFRVEENFWFYNNFDKLELLTYFVTKGNDIGYRELCLKILGIDYYLFPFLSEYLREQNLMYVTNIILDESSYSAEVKYESKEQLISKNVYEKLKNISNMEDSMVLYYGEDTAKNNIDSVKQVLSTVIEGRFVPEIDPKSYTNEAEKNAKKLNIDLYSPVFFQSSYAGYSNLLSTGKLHNQTFRNSFVIESTVGSSRIWNAGHLTAFGKYVDQNANQILGGDESILGEDARSYIWDAYIRPLPKSEYIEKYITSVVSPYWKPLYQVTTEETINGKKQKIQKPYYFQTLGSYSNDSLRRLVATAEEIKKAGKRAIKFLGGKEGEDRTIPSTDVTPQRKADLETLKIKYGKNGNIKQTSNGDWEINVAILDELMAEVNNKYLESITTWSLEGRRFFNSEFLEKSVTKESKQVIQTKWNEMFNNQVQPKLDKQPIFPTHSINFGKRDKQNRFALLPAQIDGIRHVASRENSGVLLHEVGFGKTTSSIASIVSSFNTKEASRALFLVPNVVYDKFIVEIEGNETDFGIAPHVNIVCLGNSRKEAIKSLKNFKPNELEIYEQLEQETKIPKKGITVFREVVENNKYFSDQIISLTAKNLPNPAYNEKENLDRWKKLIDARITERSPKALTNKVVKSKIDKIVPFINSYVADKIVGLGADLALLTSGLSIDAKTASAEGKKKKASAESDVRKFYAEISEELKPLIDRELRRIAIYLIDDLGEYKPECMKPNTIILAKHNAIEQLRPSFKGLMSAHNFVEGKEFKRWLNQEVKGGSRTANSIMQTNPISFDKLNIDAIVVDEIHNFNSIIGKVGVAKTGFDDKSGIIHNLRESQPREEFDRLFWGASFESFDDKGNLKKRNYPNRASTPIQRKEKSGRSGKKAIVQAYDTRWKRANKSKFVLASLCFETQQKNRDSKNVILLSATPFTDSPMQVISVLGMANAELLQNLGIQNSFDFFNTYIKEVWKVGIRHDGTQGLMNEVENYYNDRSLSNLITTSCSIKITDEKIEKNRPKKAIVPQNSTEKGVNKMQSMGIYFEELKNATSKVEMSDQQKEIDTALTKYLEDDTDTRKIYEIFDSEKVLSANEIKDAKELTDKIKEIKQGLGTLKDEEDDNLLSAMDKIDDLFLDFPDHPTLIKEYNSLRRNLTADARKEIEQRTSAELDLDSLIEEERRTAKTIVVQTAKESLVVSPYFVTFGEKGSHQLKSLPDLTTNPSQIFVENSPKLLLTAKLIQQALDYQKKELELGNIDKIGGQVVYFNRMKFVYGGVSYNAFNLFAEYLANNLKGISKETEAEGYKEIAMIGGGANKDEDSTSVKRGKTVVTKRGKVTIKNKFNDGTIKILIGSKAIKEGIDLQKNAHSMYICQAEFSPTVSMQLEGRIWRQGNPYDAVRIVYVLALNSIDAFIYDKLNKKVNSIRQMLEKGAYEMNMTQFTIDTQERLLSMITDVEKLVAITFTDKKNLITNEYNILSNQIQGLRNLSKDAVNMFDSFDVMLNYLNLGLKYIEQLEVNLAKTKILNDLRTERKEKVIKQKRKLTLDWSAEKKLLKGEKLEEFNKKYPNASSYIEDKATAPKVTEKQVEDVLQKQIDNGIVKFKRKAIVLNNATPFTTLKEKIKAVNDFFVDGYEGLERAGTLGDYRDSVRLFDKEFIWETEGAEGSANRNDKAVFVARSPFFATWKFPTYKYQLGDRLNVIYAPQKAQKKLGKYDDNKPSEKVVNKFAPYWKALAGKQGDRLVEAMSKKQNYSRDYAVEGIVKDVDGDKVTIEIIAKSSTDLFSSQTSATIELVIDTSNPLANELLDLEFIAPRVRNESEAILVDNATEPILKGASPRGKLDTSIVKYYSSLPERDDLSIWSSYGDADVNTLTRVIKYLEENSVLKGNTPKNTDKRSPLVEIGLFRNISNYFIKEFEISFRTYQSVILTDNKLSSNPNLTDAVSEAVEKVEVKRQESKDALSNEQGIRDELKEYWTKVIESKIERQEMDVNQIVNSFEESLKIIKIRKK